MFFRQKKSGNRVYLQIVENRWEDGRSKQRVITTLGRLDQLQQTGQLEGLLRSGTKFCQSALLLAAHRRGETTAMRTRPIGPAMIFERLWQQTGCRKVIGRLLAGRKFEFPVERAVFSTVLHRLFTSGSDRAAEKWKETLQIDGIDRLQLHHLYRAMAWLGDRETIVASLREQLKRGDKSLVGNRGFRKYLKEAKSKFEIDEQKIKHEARYDGKWVLRTNTDLSAAEVALKYKQLWMVEHVFRSTKSLLETRPIWHNCDETRRDDSWARFLLVPGVGLTQGTRRPTGRAGSQAGVGRRDPRLGQSANRRSPAGRQAIPVAKRSPRDLWQSIRRGGRRVTADCPTSRGPITMPLHPASNCRAWCHAQIACT